MADDRDEQEPQSSQETAVGHSVVDESAAAEDKGGTEATEVFFSRDQAQQESSATVPPTPRPPSEEGKEGGSSPAEADRIASDQQDSFAEKPHVYVLGAFAGAFVFAQILKRITGGDD
jgi:hypothetical protein